MTDPKFDKGYARRKLALVLRDLNDYTAAEFWREINRITSGATGLPSAEELAPRVKELEAINLGLTKTLVEMEAENAELRKDAERYRWVRSQASPIKVFIYGVDEGLAVEALDEALDRDLYGEADDEGKA